MPLMLALFLHETLPAITGGEVPFLQHYLGWAKRLLVRFDFVY